MSLTALIRVGAIWSALLGLFAPPGVAGTSVELVGVVKDQGGSVVPGVVVSVRDTVASTVTDESGQFQLKGDFTGQIVLIVAKAGLQTTEKIVPATMFGPAGMIEIVMQVALLRQEIEVDGTPPASVSPQRVAINLLDILTTAGTDADPIKAVQSLPGVAKVDEGAGLYVDGGDVSEVSTYINSSLLPHPYQFETQTGGFFGSVDPFFLEGVSLATAGFPARYGNALSGVLDLQMMPRPATTTLFANVGLASTSLAMTEPLGDHAGFRVAAARTFTGLLFAVNQPSQRFTQNPGGYNLATALYFDSKKWGDFTGYFYRGVDKTGVVVEEGSFIGNLDAGSTKMLFSANWERPIAGGWKVNVNLSHSTLNQAQEADTLDISNTETGTRGKLDVSGPLSGGVLRTGFEFEKVVYGFLGTVPILANDLAGIGGVNSVDFTAAERRLGTYLEYERTLGRFTLNLGVRTDGYHTANSRSVDPRPSVEYALTKRQRLRFAWGIYHQAPSAFYLDPYFGNPHLGLMSARHTVVGYSYGEESGKFFVRVQGYNKGYRGLPTQADNINFDSSGYGYARGIDTLVKGRFGHGWDGWVSYSILSAKRRWTTLENYAVFPGRAPLAPPDFDIPEMLQVVLHGRLPASFGFGATFRAASGKPYTPVVGAEASGTGYLPVYGPINSERTPVYQRFDLTLSRAFSVDRIAVMPYLGVNNVLNHNNIFEYVYSADFSQRRPATSTYGRAFYFGFVFQK